MNDDERSADLPRIEQQPGYEESLPLVGSQTPEGTASSAEPEGAVLPPRGPGDIAGAPLGERLEEQPTGE